MYSINISTLSVKYTTLKHVLFSCSLAETKLRSSSLNVPLPRPGSALSTASHRSASTSPHTSPHNHSPTSSLGSLNVGPVSSSFTRRYEGGGGGGREGGEGGGREEREEVGGREGGEGGGRREGGRRGRR